MRWISRTERGPPSHRTRRMPSSASVGRRRLEVMQPLLTKSFVIVNENFRHYDPHKIVKGSSMPAKKKTPQQSRARKEALKKPAAAKKAVAKKVAAKKAVAKKPIAKPVARKPAK